VVGYVSVPMRVVVDQNVPSGLEAFSAAGDVSLVQGRTLRREDLDGCHVLIVRSGTKVDARLLEGTSVRFVGTCTIGTDHMDIPWLESAGIRWTSAPGCNARSVAEWVVSALALAHRSGRLDLGRVRRAGIVGVGHVGRQVASVLHALGWEVWRNDPPRAHLEGSDGFHDLDELLAGCPVVCAHLPLVHEGEHPTAELLGRNLSLLPRDAVFLNAGRGATVSNDALLQLRADRPDIFLGVDVFQPEPAFPAEIARLSDLCSPHVAGHSLEGKIEGTRLVREALGEFLELPPWSPPPLPQEPIEVQGLHLSDAIAMTRDSGTWDALAALVGAAFDPARDDATMRSLLDLSDERRGEAFDRVRKDYPRRLQWEHRPVLDPRRLPPRTWDLALRLGFRSA
jgi:erythronate-4-phosphate dehydrogenase